MRVVASGSVIPANVIVCIPSVGTVTTSPRPWVADEKWSDALGTSRDVTAVPSSSTEYLGVGYPGRYASSQSSR